MSNILEISNLSINFATRDGSFKAVDDISFNIDNSINKKKENPTPIVMGHYCFKVVTAELA